LKCFNNTISTFGIFAAASITLLLYLLGMRYHAFLPVPVFFVSIVVMLGTIIYQGGFLKLERRLVYLILLEIMIANLLFHLIYQIPGYGLWGSDAYADFASMKGILDSGFVMGVPSYVQLTSYFPILHVLGAQFTLVTGIIPLEVAKWLPSIIHIALIPLLFLFIKQIFRNDKAALFGALLFACLQQSSLFDSFFIRETIAEILALGCVYFYWTAKSSGHPTVYRTLSMLLLVATVLAHHLTSVMLIVFLVIHFLVTYANKVRTLRSRYFPDGINGESLTLSLIILAVVLPLTYWVIEIMIPLRVLATFILDVITPATWGKGTYVDMTGMGFALPTLRYYVLVYGSYFCYIVFGLLMLVRIRPKEGSRHLEMYSFTLFLLLCGILGIVSFFFLPATVIGNRFITYGWLFAFGPLVVAITEYRNRWLVQSALGLVVIYIFINMFTIHPTEWNPGEPGSGATASLQDFKMAETFSFTQGNVLANLNDLTAIYYTQNVDIGTDVFSISNPIKIEDYSWIIINQKGLDEEGLYSQATLDAVSELRTLNKNGSTGYNLIFESSNLTIFKKIAIVP
jgi:hypothetical protein